MKERMTSLQRVQTVIAGGVPDRIPVCLLNFQNAARFAGYQVGECILDAHKLAQSQIAYWEAYRHDMIEIENGVAALAEAAGCVVEYPEDAAPWVKAPAIRSLDEVHRLVDIDVHASPGTRALVDSTRMIAQKLGKDVCIRGDCDQGPFSLASQLLGMEQFYMELLNSASREKIHALLEYATEQVYRLACAQIEAGAHYTVFGDSPAGPDVCSPRVYRQFAAPYEKILVERLRAKGIEAGNHICGNATPIIGDMLATGCSYFELDYKINREAVSQAVKGRATVIGTLDPSGLITFGTPEEVREKAREDMLIFGQQGGFILGPGCTIPETAPFENVAALVAAAREDGWYRPDGKLVIAAD